MSHTKIVHLTKYHFPSIKSEGRYWNLDKTRILQHPTYYVYCNGNSDINLSDEERKFNLNPLRYTVDNIIKPFDKQWMKVPTHLISFIKSDYEYNHMIDTWHLMDSKQQNNDPETQA